jgi:hypothetical protein
MTVKVTKPNQRAAVEGVLDYARGTRPPVVDPKTGAVVRYPAVNGLVLLGGVGTGKTHITAVALRALAHAETLVVVPPCGGVVLNQWVDEFRDVGLEAVFVYHGGRRAERLATFRAENSDKCRFVVTTAHTLHSDVAAVLQASSSGGEQKKRRAATFTREQWSNARATAASNFGSFQCLVVDELQEFRNGSPPHDATKEVDESKSLYPTLDRFAQHARPALVIGLSATPIVNSSGDLYSFTRWFRQGASFKQNIIDRARRGSPAEKAAFKRESAELRLKHFVKVGAPPCPATDYGAIAHGYSTDESAVLSTEYGRLATLAERFHRALKDWLQNRNNPVAVTKKDRYKLLFFSQLTKCKRITIAPLIFNRETERADPAANPARDAHGEIIRYEDEAGNEVVLGKPLPFPCQRVKAEVSLASVSKFRAIVEHLRGVTDERVMIVSEFSDPLEMLKLYLQEAFPGREVYMFHGGVARRDRELAAFKEGADDAILLATRGACGMAVNVECTTRVDTADGPRRKAVAQLQLDIPMSMSAQEQCEGRVKRCLAQGWPDDDDRVRAYDVKKVQACKSLHPFPTLDDWLLKVVNAKSTKAGDLLADREGGDANAGEGDEGSLAGVLVELISTLGSYRPAAKRSKGAKKRAAPVEGGDGKKLRSA